MTERPSWTAFFRVWLGLGLQSFGGGTATLYLIQRAVVDQQRWVSAEEFSHNWAMVQLAPGINLLAITTLIGWEVAGAAGIIAALGGLLLPSIGITILVTATYASISTLPIVEAALQGVIPATVGLGLFLSYRLLMPTLSVSRREGRVSVAVCLALVVGAMAATWWLHWPVLLTLLVGGVLGGVFQWGRALRFAEAPEA
ncbi:MAG: chromate transporter [Anaerolineae bacterium]